MTKAYPIVLTPTQTGYVVTVPESDKTDNAHKRHRHRCNQRANAHTDQHDCSRVNAKTLGRVRSAFHCVASWW